jgi:hypothetical protein
MDFTYALAKIDNMHQGQDLEPKTGKSSAADTVNGTSGGVDWMPLPLPAEVKTLSSALVELS